jgi:hypothetical protein
LNNSHNNGQANDVTSSYHISGGPFYIEISMFTAKAIDILVVVLYNIPIYKNKKTIANGVKNECIFA